MRFHVIDNVIVYTTKYTKWVNTHLACQTLEIELVFTVLIKIGPMSFRDAKGHSLTQKVNLFLFSQFAINAITYTTQIRTELLS